MRLVKAVPTLFDNVDLIAGARPASDLNPERAGACDGFVCWPQPQTLASDPIAACLCPMYQKEVL